MYAIIFTQPLQWYTGCFFYYFFAHIQDTYELVYQKYN